MCLEQILLMTLNFITNMFSWLFNDYDFLLIRQVKYQNCFKKKSGKRKIFWTSYLEVHCLVEKNST